MLQEITRATAAKIKNPVFRDYANMYLNIYDNFVGQVETFGLPFHKAQDHMKETEEIRAQLADMNVLNRCEGASLVYMIAQNLAQGFVQKVGRAVGAADGLASLFAVAGLHLVADGKFT